MIARRDFRARSPGWSRDRAGSSAPPARQALLVLVYLKKGEISTEVAAGPVLPVDARAYTTRAKRSWGLRIT